ncbi:MAG: AMP-binding protein, partial [Okeania sp. SIO2H7]|nr:AMP-binding protein [Okeania sp. SIO2H7]
KLVSSVRGWSQRLNLGRSVVETLEQLRGFAPDTNIYKSQPQDLAVLLLTSGSTGIPKAVMQKNSNLLSMSAGTIAMNQFSSQDVTLNWMPMDHVGALVFLSIMAVDLGCQQIHVPTELILQSPLKWLDLIDCYQATISWAPNFAFTLIGDRAEEVKKRHWNLSSMKFLVNAGEAIVTKTARNFLQLLNSYGLSTTAIHPAFGMCETCSGITWSNSFSLESSSDEDKFVELGQPIAGTCLRIVDGNQQVVGEGVVGFLQVKGASVTSGYYQNITANKEAFTADGWFNTGDLGFLKNGCLTITGRQKDVIIINGLNYYSHEIESALE